MLPQYIVSKIEKVNFISLNLDTVSGGRALTNCKLVWRFLNGDHVREFRSCNNNGSNERVACPRDVNAGSHALTVDNRRLDNCHTATHVSVAVYIQRRVPPGTGLICTNRERVARRWLPSLLGTGAWCPGRPAHNPGPADPRGRAPYFSARLDAPNVPRTTI